MVVASAVFIPFWQGEGGMLMEGMSQSPFHQRKSERNIVGS